MILCDVQLKRYALRGTVARRKGVDLSGEWHASGSEAGNPTSEDFVLYHTRRGITGPPRPPPCIAMHTPFCAMLTGVWPSMLYCRVGAY